MKTVYPPAFCRRKESLKKAFPWRFIFSFSLCLLAVVLVFYLYLEDQNQVTFLSVEIPAREGTLRRIQEENKRLEYQVDLSHSPFNLIKMHNQPEFRHLFFPTKDEVKIVSRENRNSESKKDN